MRLHPQSREFLTFKGIFNLPIIFSYSYSRYRFSIFFLHHQSLGAQCFIRKTSDRVDFSSWYESQITCSLIKNKYYRGDFIGPCQKSVSQKSNIISDTFQSDIRWLLPDIVRCPPFISWPAF